MTWPECVAFQCSICREHAIELLGSDAAVARECSDCFGVPDLADAPELEAEDPEAPPNGGATEAEAVPFPAGGGPREESERSDRSATQRTRPGSPPATPAGSPESRTVARRDSIDSPGSEK